MSDTSPALLNYRSPAATCPVCLKPIAKPHKCKTLYGVTVCNKCRNGFANRRQAAYIVDAIIFSILGQAVMYSLFHVTVNSGGVATVLLQLLSWVAVPFAFTFKDAFGGWSAGKRLFGVRVVDATTRQPITPIKSMQRNLVLMIPYVGVIGGVITMMKGPRWGDRWANTMVTWCKWSFREPFAPPGQFCRGWGYDLTGNVSGRCPECGMETAATLAPVPALPLPNEV